ncbi:MAG: dihydroorotase [bacterium]|nr:dihydroorotase [bacterium]
MITNQTTKLIRGGRILDPASGRDGIFDLLIQNGQIARIDPQIAPPPGAEIIDATGLLVVPGLVDIHTHLREPGYEYKETILTGSQAAAAGGFTSLACMANTDPPNDNSSVTEFIRERAQKAGLVNIYPVGAVSKGLKGESLAEIGSMVASGIVAVSDDGNPVMNSGLMRNALEYTQIFDIPVISHCEDLGLSQGGQVNEGLASLRTGLAGIPAEAEVSMVVRDLLLARLTGGKLHLAHISTARSVDAIRAAKAQGLKVTAETAPHYFTLTEEAVLSFDTNAKVNPPLRSAADREAVRNGLRDGTIDCIASDHAPHSLVEKDLEFTQASSGTVGLETTLPLTLKLVQEGLLSLSQAIALLSINPARILNLKKGSLSIGADADITVIDPGRKLTVDPEKFRSRGRNTAFPGLQLQGRAAITLIRGEITFRE